MSALLGVVGCRPSQKTVVLDEDRGEVYALRELSDGTLLVAGESDYEGAIFRIAPDRKSEKVFTGHQTVFDLAVREPQVWAIVDDVHRLLVRSDDMGRTWSTPKPLAFEYASRLCATSTELWLLYRHLLWRSSHAGKSWNKVVPPSMVDLQTRFRCTDDSLLLFGNDFFVTRDGGKKWSRPYGNAVIDQVSEDLTHGVEKIGDRRYRVVALGDKLVPRGVPFSTDGIGAVFAKGSQLRVLAHKRSEKYIDVGWHYHSSDDGGMSWSVVRFRSRYGAAPDHPVLLGRTHDIGVLITKLAIGFVER